MNRFGKDVDPRNMYLYEPKKKKSYKKFFKKKGKTQSSSASHKLVQHILWKVQELCLLICLFFEAKCKNIFKRELIGVKTRIKI